ncbi:MAG: hypothetical protein K8F91_15855 [Candidatus Obscuribacterales bacterium]|nr:hypothetical protein [Candidatus Obscuribacterales bacterium]
MTLILLLVLTSLSACLIAGSLPVCAANSQHGPEKKQNPVLQGGLKNEETLKPHLEVIPGENSVKKPFGAGVTQYSGSAQYKPGQHAPSLPFVSPFRPTRPFSPQKMRGVIPPISSYTLTPRNGIITYGPAFEAQTIQTHHSTMSTVPSMRSVPPHHRYKGISSYGDEPEITVQSSHSGLTSWQPGYGGIPGGLSRGSGSAGTSSSGLTSYGTGHEVSVAASNGGLRTYSPGHDLTVHSSQHGVVCWSPGYEVSIQKPGLEKSSLGGSWSANRRQSAVGQGLAGTPLSIPANMIYAQAVQPNPLQAKALLLSGLGSEPRASNWHDWYELTASAIYTRWKHVEVGPGIAIVEVLVDKNRNISGKVLDFMPAEGAQRDVKAETEFRESAIRSVNLISRFEIPEFPPDSKLEHVSFEVDMKRTVDGSAGFNIGPIASEKK